MRITRRRNAIVFSITLGACLVALAIALNVAWVIINWRSVILLVIGILFFLLLIAGLILNTIFLVREVKRNERHDSFLNAVTHELKTPITSIRLYLETLQRHELPESNGRSSTRSCSPTVSGSWPPWSRCSRREKWASERATRSACSSSSTTWFAIASAPRCSATICRSQPSVSPWTRMPNSSP